MVGNKVARKDKLEHIEGETQVVPGWKPLGKSPANSLSAMVSTQGRDLLAVQNSETLEDACS